ncbi:GH39 family glycosyl hydrolase [Butyrivibrio fibrisolvens]|uniref:GH39 family glycosyl hydrolase n=1 Tax=Butyrivibrio fibrisolvens TaxID=831 RepID=UPI00041F719C|nr:glycosyl hydrolase [Butyrivibrio fibrisolvens]
MENQKTINKSISVKAADTAPFYNNVDFCVGTGRFGLALTKEYLDELAFVQEEIGFKHIRGHGIFTDDTAIYHEYEEDGINKVEYNYTYLDRIMDEYLKLGIRPFIELGFMPKDLASGTQTIFYWKGNTTPPKSYERWCDLVVALLSHLIDRYGESDVTTWPIEVWNEPNLPGFWEHADMKEYCKLFKETFTAIKDFNPSFKVGGPAICGVKDAEWIKGFLDFCKESGLKPDFITRHHYTIEFPKADGHYDYSTLMDEEEGFANLQSTRDIIDSYDEYKGLPIHITEFSSSYTPKGVIHDTNLNAALIARQLSRLGDMNESYSYWTFGDVFEETGVPFSLFHGGFGLVAAGCIPKPTFWTFKFFKDLKVLGRGCVFKDDNAVIEKTDKGYAGVLWNESSEEGISIKLDLEDIAKDGDTDNEYTLIIKIVSPKTTNPLKLWHDLGEPATPNSEQTKLIKSAAFPQVTSDRLTTSEGSISFDQTLDPETVVYFELSKSKVKSDRGYSYERTITTR